MTVTSVPESVTGFGTLKVSKFSFSFQCFFDTNGSGTSNGTPPDYQFPLAGGKDGLEVVRSTSKVATSTVT